MRLPHYFSFILRSNRRIAATLVSLLVLLITILSLSNGNDEDQSASSKDVTVRQGNIKEVVTAQGKLEPKEYVDVGAQVSGQLKKIHFGIGDVVKAGDLLAEIDPRVYKAKVQADQARLKTLRAQLSEQHAQIMLAEQQHQRDQSLIASNAVSQEALEEGYTTLKVAQARAQSLEAQIEEAQSSLEGSETNLSYTTIFAPIDGTVVSQNAQEGQTLNANQQAPVIMQLANLDLMTVRAQIAEADVARIAVNQKVYFTTFGSLEKQWNGSVRQILPTPEVINDVVLYNALVDVDNNDRQLMTGMSTQMFFQLASAENVPLIPVTALGKRISEKDSEIGRAYQVLVRSGREVENRIVQIGLMNRFDAEVRDGLSIGDLVVVASNQTRQPEGGRPPGLRGGARL